MDIIGKRAVNYTVQRALRFLRCKLQEKELSTTLNRFKVFEV